MQILQVCVTAFFGVLGISFAAQNYLGGKLPILLRLGLFASGGCLIYPGWMTDLLGLAFLVIITAIRVPDTFRRYTIGWLHKNASV
jgi:TRAP-type uncharacterized transport system fused permease subunit